MFRSVKIPQNVTKTSGYSRLEWTHPWGLYPYLDHSLLVASPGQPPRVELVLDLQLTLPEFHQTPIVANLLLSMQAKLLQGGP